MIVPIMPLIYGLLFNNNNNNNNTRLDKLIEYLKQYKLINNKNWDNINNLKLNENDNIYLSFNNNNKNISLETIDTNEALKKYGFDWKEFFWRKSYARIIRSRRTDHSRRSNSRFQKPLLGSHYRINLNFPGT